MISKCSIKKRFNKAITLKHVDQQVSPQIQLCVQSYSKCHWEGDQTGIEETASLVTVRETGEGTNSLYKGFSAAITFQIEYAYGTVFFSDKLLKPKSSKAVRMLQICVYYYGLLLGTETAEQKCQPTNL